VLKGEVRVLYKTVDISIPKMPKSKAFLVNKQTN